MVIIANRDEVRLAVYHGVQQRHAELECDPVLTAGICPPLTEVVLRFAHAEDKKLRVIRAFVLKEGVNLIREPAFVVRVALACVRPYCFTD